VAGPGVEAPDFDASGVTGRPKNDCFISWPRPNRHGPACLGHLSRQVRE
jgi:hypothetical protein